MGIISYHAHYLSLPPPRKWYFQLPGEYPFQILLIYRLNIHYAASLKLEHSGGCVHTKCGTSSFKINHPKSDFEFLAIHSII